MKFKLKAPLWRIQQTYPIVLLYALVAAEACLELVVVRLTPQFVAGQKAFAVLLEIFVAFVTPERKEEDIRSGRQKGIDDISLIS